MSVATQRSHLNALLETLNLQVKVNTLPLSLSEGSASGPLATHLSDLSLEHEEGPYFPFNRAWDTVFQVSQDEQKALVCRGEHGIKLTLKAPSGNHIFNI